MPFHKDNVGAGGWQALKLWLDVNGHRRQEIEAGMMLTPVPVLIRYISSIMTLEPGDLILTGTPAGVGPVFPGDRITAGIVSNPALRVGVMVDVVEPAPVTAS